MSLNGLDSAAVQEAYQVAVVEAGGWFLLKYTSRDAVELLGRGKGGVHEARYAIAKYDEPSPLYGLIIYRRRKVLIKYIPEGTSRLLQARTAVHFQDVTERYAPYETLLEIKTAEGLSDTSLAASFPLHTASPAASSSRLHEISEDGEDGGPVSRRSANARTTSSDTGFPTQRLKAEKRVDEVMRSNRSPPPPAIQVNGDGMHSVSPISSPLSSPKKTSVSHFLVRDDSGHRSITSLGTPSIASLTEYSVSEASSTETAPSADPPKASSPTSPTMKPLPKEPPMQNSPPRIPEKSAGRHASSNSIEKELPSMPPVPLVNRSISDERPVTAERLQYDEDPYDFSKFDSIFKPKVKLGPRPVAAGEKTKRALTASISVPATYKPTMKKQEPMRPASQQAPKPMSASAPAPVLPVLPAPPPIPNVPEYSPRPLSRGSVKSLPSHKSTAMTPDKIRLMKAVELRKKQLRKSNPQPQTYTPTQGEETPAVPSLPEQAPKPEPEKAPRNPALAETIAQDPEQMPSKKADSGIEMVYDKGDGQDVKNEAEEPQIQESRKKSIEPAVTAKRDPSEPSSPRTPKQEVSPVQASHDSPPLQSGGPPSPKISIEKKSPKVPSQGSPKVSSPHYESETTSPVFDRPFEDADLANLLPEEPATVPRIVMADGSRPISSNVQPPKPEDDSDVDTEADSSSSDESMDQSGDLGTSEMSPRRQNSDLARRRRGFVEPLHVDGEELTSDDDFMEELQTATLQHAKPMTVAKSPVTQLFQRRPSANSALSDASDGASFNNADMAGRFSPDSTGGDHTRSRSISGEKNDPMAGLKRNVSSGITKRIQALAEISSRETSPQGLTAPARPLTPETWANGFLQSDQKDPRGSMRSPPPKSRTASFKSAARLSSRMSSSDRRPSTNSVQQTENAPTWNVQRDATANPESVSVTARIVRPAMDELNDFANQTDQAFQQSELVISHTRATATQTSAPQLPRIDTNPNPQPPSRSTTPSMSPTFTRGSTEGGRQLHSAYRNTMGRHKAAFSPTTPIADDFPPPPSHNIHSSTSLASNDENGVSKEGTRTSRFFKRMSNIGSKRRSAAQQSHGSSSPSDGASLMVRNASLASKDKSDMPPPIIVGDLNVQFPDSLLWKRRIIEIDESGYLIFSIPQAMDHQRSSSKKYALSEFRMPYVPDLDRQELPNSVMLDFVDGTTLQAACEDTMTHQQVAHVLKSYWRAWAGS